MIHARKRNAFLRWLILGLSLHGVAAALLLSNVLSSSSERRRPREIVAGAVERVEAELAPLAAPPAARRELAGGERERDELALRAQDAAEALAEALEAPEYEDALWREEVHERARTLGSDAQPALRALLADDSRSVEEHVAASELLAALPAD